MAVVLLIPRAEEQLVKIVALLTTLVTLGVGIAILARFDFDEPGLQFTVNEPWIKVIHSRYHVGIDGISLPLLLLTMFITVLCVIYSWNHFPAPHNPKAFLALILLLEVGMIGTFVAQDLILFFIFFEIVLLPMFFMIGVWGGPNREYASIKFFLFTLFGSAMMLLSFLALFFLSKVRTFDMVTLTHLHGAGIVLGAGEDQVARATEIGRLLEQFGVVILDLGHMLEQRELEVRQRCLVVVTDVPAAP